MSVDAKGYIPRFVSERPSPLSECGMAAGVMGAEGSTLGKCTDGLGKDGLIALLTELRLSQGIVTGGQSIGQVDRALQQKWPDVPPMQRPIGEASGLRLTWAEFVARLGDGWCAIVNGNPSQVTNPASKLRQWQSNDNYNHSIHVAGLTADGQAIVQDPLGPWLVYTSQPVPLKEVSQYAWRTPDGKVYAGLWQKGGGAPAVEPPATGPGDPISEEQMVTLTQNLSGYSTTVKSNTNVRSVPTRQGNAPLRTTSSTETWTVAGFVAGEMVSGSDQWLMRFGSAGTPEYVHASTLAAPPTAPITQADYDLKVNELTGQLTVANASLLETSADLATAKTKAGEIVAL